MFFFLIIFYSIGKKWYVVSDRMYGYVASTDIGMAIKAKAQPPRKHNMNLRLRLMLRLRFEAITVYYFNWSIKHKAKDNKTDYL